MEIQLLEEENEEGRSQTALQSNQNTQVVAVETKTSQTLHVSNELNLTYIILNIKIPLPSTLFHGLLLLINLTLILIYPHNSRLATLV